MCGCGFFFVKQETEFDMRISDWGSDVCSSGLCVSTGLFIQSRNASLVASLRVLLPDVAATTSAPIIFMRATLGACRSISMAQHGRASCRERVCQYLSISVVAVALKQKQDDKWRQETWNDMTSTRKKKKE